MARRWTCLLPTGSLILASRYRLREWLHPPFRCPSQKLRFHSLIPPSLTPFFLSIIKFHQGTLTYTSSLLLICACPLTAPFSWTTQISSMIISLCSFQTVSRMRSMIMNNHSKNQVRLRMTWLAVVTGLEWPSWASSQCMSISSSSCPACSSPTLPSKSQPGFSTRGSSTVCSLPLSSWTLCPKLFALPFFHSPTLTSFKNMLRHQINTLIFPP